MVITGDWYLSLKVDKKKKEKKDKERENEKEKNALTKEKVQRKRQTTSPTTMTQRSRPETRYGLEAQINCLLPYMHHTICIFKNVKLILY